MGTHTELTIEAVGASVSNKIMMAGGGTGIVGVLASINWLGLIGAAVAIIGLAGNLYFQKRRERFEAIEREHRRAAEERREAREIAESNARIAALKAGSCEL